MTSMKKRVAIVFGRSACVLNSAIELVPISDFKVNFLSQKLSESFYFFIEEYQIRLGHVIVIDIF